MVEGLSDGELVAAALKGSQEAFGELVARYRDAVFGAAFHRLGRFEEARDAAQEAFVKAYLNLANLRKQESFANWLYHIADGTARDFARRPRREVALESVAEGALTDNTNGEQTEQSDLALQVREALSKLGESTRLAVILHYINGYSHAEVANFLGTSTGAVKTRISRAKSKLREEIEPMKKALKKAERWFYYEIIHPGGKVTSGMTEARSRADVHAALSRLGYQIKRIRLATKKEQPSKESEGGTKEPITRLLLILLSELFRRAGNHIKMVNVGKDPKSQGQCGMVEVSFKLAGKWHLVMTVPDYLWTAMREMLSQMANIELHDKAVRQKGTMLFMYWRQECRLEVMSGKTNMEIRLPKGWIRKEPDPMQKAPKDNAIYAYSIDSKGAHILSGMEDADSLAHLKQNLGASDGNVYVMLRVS